MSSQSLWNELGDIARSLAREAGEHALVMRLEAIGNVTTKSSSTDVVTSADTATEQLILERLTTLRPHDAVLGEEGAAVTGTTGVVWHIDPIDGTTNYLYGIPQFSVSIGAELDGDVVAGAVFNPSTDEMFSAIRGSGAILNDQSISANTETDLGRSLVATGFGYQAHIRSHQAEILGQIIPHIRDIRRIGSAALDLCSLAAGRIDAYYEQGLNQWDLAAGTLIATEAGARVENLTGGPPDSSFLLGVTATLFEPLKAKLVAAGAGSPPKISS